MPIKKHNWIKYGKNKSIICEIKLLDESNRRLDFFRFSTSDKNSQRTVGNILKSSYGLTFQKFNKEDEDREVQRAMKEDLDF